MGRVITCYCVLNLLGIDNNQYFKVEDFKGVTVNKEFVEKAIENDTKYFKKYEDEVNEDKAFLAEVQTSLQLEKENKENESLKEFEKLFDLLKSLNSEYVRASNTRCLSKEFYDNIQKLDNSRVENIKSKALSTELLNHPAYELHLKINSVKENRRYCTVCIALENMKRSKEQMSQLIEYLKENGFPNKTYAQIVKDKKKINSKR